MNKATLCAACVLSAAVLATTACSSRNPAPPVEAAVQPGTRLIKAHILEAATARAMGDVEVIPESEAFALLAQGKVLSAPQILVNVGQDATVTLGDDDRLMSLSVRPESKAGDDVYAISYTESRKDKPSFELKAVRVRCKFGEAIVLQGLLGPGHPRTIIVWPAPGQ